MLPGVSLTCPSLMGFPTLIKNIVMSLYYWSVFTRTKLWSKRRG